MKVSIRNLEKRLSMILPLAEAYQRSYNKLSADYKSESEMALYTKGYFIKKLWKMAEDDQSTVAVLHLNDVRAVLSAIRRFPSITRSRKTAGRRTWKKAISTVLNTPGAARSTLSAKWRLTTRR